MMKELLEQYITKIGSRSANIAFQKLKDQVINDNEAAQLLLSELKMEFVKAKNIYNNLPLDNYLQDVEQLNDKIKILNTLIGNSNDNNLLYDKSKLIYCSPEPLSDEEKNKNLYYYWYSINRGDYVILKYNYEDKLFNIASPYNTDFFEANKMLIRADILADIKNKRKTRPDLYVEFFCEEIKGETT